MGDAVMRARKRGAQLVTGLFAIGLFASELRRLGAAHLTPIELAYLTLFLTVGGLAYLWLSSTEDELDQLMQYLDPSTPSSLRPSSAERATIFLIAAVLCGLLYSTRDPLLFGSFFSVYSVIALLSTRHVNLRLGRIFANCRQRLREELLAAPLDRRLPLYSSGVDILENYYNTKRHLVRHSVILGVSLAGTAVAGYARSRKSQSLEMAAYVIFILLLVASEAVIMQWRHNRNSLLDPTHDQLETLQHDGYTPKEN